MVHCSLESYIANGWSMDHQALPAVDVPILASPDTFVAQLLAAPPERMNYQGVLRDAADKPLTGSYTMAFRFYDAASGGIQDRYRNSGRGHRFRSGPCPRHRTCSHQEKPSRVAQDLARAFRAFVGRNRPARGRVERGYRRARTERDVEPVA